VYKGLESKTTSCPLIGRVRVNPGNSLSSSW